MEKDLATCGCKGIRTCLICENAETISNQLSIKNQTCLVYDYCPHCNLCWPDQSSLPESCSSKVPLYLDGVMIIPDFINEEEEKILVSDIDSLPWMPSQSGRLKQDFGPKVNFKKKKVKNGNFRGFPVFIKSILQKLDSVPSLSDFHAVELCNLDYNPARGSAIDAHKDDSWLWGDRLITLNLCANTVLILTPTSINSCQCSSVVHETDCIDRGKTKFSTNTTCYHSTEDSDVMQQTLCDSIRFKDELNVKVRIPLLQRSLFILSSCARYNWLHEIQRCDVSSRRIAVTFRELSEEFLPDGKESQKGQELIKIAQSFFQC